MSIKKTIENLQKEKYINKMMVKREGNKFSTTKKHTTHIENLQKKKVINLQASSSSPDNQIRKSKKKPEI